MAAMASGLAGTGWCVVRIEFPSMAQMRQTGRRQGPDRMPVLQKALRQQVQLEKTEQPVRPIFSGGKSMVGRTFGTREEVESYALSTQVQLQSIISGDHSFKPSKSLGLSEARN
jgi:predicted alpha/beta-hydrolase family hydrolase